jgi:hypothetical protein
MTRPQEEALHLDHSGRGACDSVRQASSKELINLLSKLAMLKHSQFIAAGFVQRRARDAPPIHKSPSFVARHCSYQV